MSIQAMLRGSWSYEVLCGQMNLVVLPLLTGNEEVDAIEMSKVSARDSVSVYTPNTCMRRQRRVEADGRHHRARVMKRTKFLAPKPNLAKETELRNKAWKLLESEGRKPSVQLEEEERRLNQRVSARWMWTVVQTSVRSWISGEKKREEVCGGLTSLRICFRVLWRRTKKSNSKKMLQF